MFVMKPDAVGQDFNDVLRKEGKAGIKEYTDKVLLEIKELKGREKSEKEENKIERIDNVALAGRCYRKWAELREEGKDALIIAPSNNLRDCINSLVREHYVRGESRHHEVYRNLGRTGVQIGDVKEYSGEEVVVFNKGIKSLGIKGDDRFRIDKIDRKDIVLRREGDSKNIKWNPEKKSRYVTLYESKTMSIGEGEKIKWTRNSSKYALMVNGGNARIEKIQGDEVAIKTDREEIKILPLNELRFMDYGHSMTSYSSQGKTADYVIGVARSKEKFLSLTHQRSFYMMLSRARKGAYLIIDNYKNLIRSLSKKAGDKTSSIEHQMIEKGIMKSTEMKRGEKLEKMMQKRAKSHLTREINAIMNIRK